jgi:hypothetical protein
MTMTRRTRDLPERRRGDLQRGSRRRSSVIDAQRRLNTRRANATATKADQVSPSDPRYAYLARTHD